MEGDGEEFRVNGGEEEALLSVAADGFKASLGGLIDAVRSSCSISAMPLRSLQADDGRWGGTTLSSVETV